MSKSAIFERTGEVAEWSNAPVSKTGIPQGIVSSNLTLSAREIRTGRGSGNGSSPCRKLFETEGFERVAIAAQQ